MIAKNLLNKIIVIFTLSLFCSALFVGGVSANEDVLAINTVSDLIEFSKDVNNGQTFSGKIVSLKNNLDLTGNSILIGTLDHPFSGTFEGNRFTISNLKIMKMNQENIGLFGYTEGATIKNLILKNVQISGNDNVGGLIGMMNGGQVTGCSVNEVNINGNLYVGGLVGLLGKECDIETCSASGKVSGKSDVGGLMGGIERKDVECKYDIVDCTVESGSSSEGDSAGTLNINMHARWIPSPKSTEIRLNKNGGTGGTDKTNATVGSPALDPEIDSPKFANHVLTGWYTKDDVHVIYANGTLIPSTEGYVNDEGKWTNTSSSLMLSAHWIYVPGGSTAIMLDNNGGTGGTSQTMATRGSSVLNPNIDLPTYDEHYLTGWYTKDGVNVIYANGELIPSTPGYVDGEGKWTNTSSILTLYAHWDSVPSFSTAIILNKNGGTGGTLQTMAHDGSSVLDPKINPPKKTGNSLTGWYTKDDVRVIYANGTLIPSTEGYVNDEGKWTNTSSSLMLYAHWVPVSPTPRHNGGGGGGGGMTVITTETPTPTAVSTVIPTDYPIQPTPSKVPTGPATPQSPIPIIGILSGFAIGGFLLTRLRK